VVKIAIQVFTNKTMPLNMGMTSEDTLMPLALGLS
jgi:hypothetical protein